jgi:hypothetical protein
LPLDEHDFNRAFCIWFQGCDQNHLEGHSSS